MEARSLAHSLSNAAKCAKANLQKFRRYFSNRRNQKCEAISGGFVAGGRIRTSAWRNQNPLPYRFLPVQEQASASAVATPPCGAHGGWTTCRAGRTAFFRSIRAGDRRTDPGQDCRLETQSALGRWPSSLREAPIPLLKRAKLHAE